MGLFYFFATLSMLAMALYSMLGIWSTFLFNRSYEKVNENMSEAAIEKRLRWIGKTQSCVDTTDPNDICRDRYVHTGWQQAYWDFGEGVHFNRVAGYVIITADFFFAINMGSVLMAAMGETAVYMSHTVNTQRRSWFFCTERSMPCKLRTVRMNSLAFFVWSLVNLVIGILILLNEPEYDSISYSALNTFHYKLNSLCFVLPVTLFLIYFYACMVKSLNQCTSEGEATQHAKGNLKRFFAGILTQYILRIAFAAGVGYYEQVICQASVRRLMYAVVMFLLDALTVVPILTLHHVSFNNTQMSSVQVDSLDDETFSDSQIVLKRSTLQTEDEDYQ